MNFAVICFVNGEFERAYPFDERREAHGFDSGLGEGASYFGGDGLFSTVVPLDGAWGAECVNDARADYHDAVPETSERLLAERQAAQAMRLRRSVGRETVPTGCVAGEGRDAK